MNSKGSEWRRWDLHLHTSSSYDYKYNADDSDSILIQTLIDNEIAAVAITDHFIIDAKHIQKLREMTSDIVFFPGVELRTDKGDTNIHVILIKSGAIEEPEIRKCVVDVLEGTYPAFDLRKKKYFSLG